MDSYRYGALKGTAWYNRLFASEFMIQLDRYPAGEVLIDNKLPDFYLDTTRWKQYRDVLLSIVTDPQKDSKTPWDFIIRFRRSRFQLFPELISEETPFIPEKNNEITDSGWSGFVHALENLPYPLFKSPEKDLKTLLETRENLLFIPSCRKKGLLEAEALLAPWSGKNIEIVTSTNPALDLPEEDDLNALSFRATSRPITSKEDLNKLNSKSRVILCCHPWFIFQLLAGKTDFIILIDDREWFIRVLLGISSSAGAKICWPESSGYQSIVTKMGHSGQGKYYILSSGNLSDFDLPSYIQPTYIHPSDRSDWTKMNDDSTKIQKSEFFWFKNEGNWERASHPVKGAIHTVILSGPEEAFKIEPIFTDKMSSPLSLESEELIFLTSFNYYFTENLRLEYEESNGSLGHWKNFLLDYLGVFNNEIEKSFETLPLYSKALLGYTKDGRLYGFHDTPLSITWSINGRNTTLTQKSINPEINPREALYLPVMGNRMVGEGRLCALVCQDEIFKVVQGPVKIPPFGAVLVTKCKLKKGMKIKWETKWSQTLVPKSSWKWLFGGFNLLIKDGVNLYNSPDKGSNSLTDEGWPNPLSQKTQETQLIAGVKQPRSVIGRTRGGKIILIVFSGRSELSVGASFEECAAIAIKLTEDDPLGFLINLDGGASASLTMIKGEKGEVLSYPASSVSNPAGVPRLVPAMLGLKIIK